MALLIGQQNQENLEPRLRPSQGSEPDQQQNSQDLRSRPSNQLVVALLVAELDIAHRKPRRTAQLKMAVLEH